VSFAHPSAKEKPDNQIAVLASEWKVTFPKDFFRVYKIETDRKVSHTMGEILLAVCSASVRERYKGTTRFSVGERTHYFRPSLLYQFANRNPKPDCP
jgi:hypothetical protein